VAQARRELLLRAHRHRLRREDLEDCYSQATLELVTYARNGARLSSRAHLANILEQRFVSRIHDRRRALSGRSPMQAALETAISLGALEQARIEIVDVRADTERQALLRHELVRVQALAKQLTPDHADWYVAEVEVWAARYGEPSNAPVQRPSLLESEAGAGAEGLEGADVGLEGKSPTAVRFIPGERAELAPGDGHLALVPAGVPATVQAMVVAGNELQELPYGPGGHPDPLGAREEDCSSTVNYVLYRAGVRPLGEIIEDNPLAQDYVSWGAPGPGRWVTIYASASPVAHVFIVIAGLRLDTSHDGTDVGPNRYENGPRWRILSHIPTWADWSVRHPPGL